MKTLTGNWGNADVTGQQRLSFSSRGRPRPTSWGGVPGTVPPRGLHCLWQASQPPGQPGGDVGAVFPFSSPWL